MLVNGIESGPPIIVDMADNVYAQAYGSLCNILLDCLNDYYCLFPKRNANVKISVQFKTETSENLTLLAYYLTDKIISIQKDNNVYIN